MGATQAWVALSSLGSHKTLRLHRRRFPCSPSTSGKRTEEPLASDVLSIKIPRMPRLKVSAWKNPFLSPSTKQQTFLRKKVVNRDSNNNIVINNNNNNNSNNNNNTTTVKKRKLNKLPPLC